MIRKYIAMIKRNVIVVGILVCMGAVLIKIVSTVNEKGKDHLLTLLPPSEQPCPSSRSLRAILVLGQSQGANTGSARTIARSGGSWMFEAGKCWHLQDPVKGPPERGGSIWPTFADRISKPVLVSNLAISGSSITTWTTPPQLKRVQRRIKEMRERGYEPIIVWMNGETDAASGMKAQEYLLHLHRLDRAIPGMRWFITRESRCYDKQSKYAALDEARDQFVGEDPTRRKMGPDLDAISVEFRQGDACHLNRKGQIIVGAEMADTFLRAFGA